MRGGDFWQGAASGFVSSFAGSAAQGIGIHGWGMVGISSASGGVGAWIAGGRAEDILFGMVQGAMVGALNHLQQGLTSRYSLVFDGKELDIIDSKDGRIVYRTNATSGKGKHMNVGASQNIENEGPIPSGKYSYESNKWKSQSKARQTYNIVAGNGDWGDYNVPLEVVYNANDSRHSFYLHGGFFKGSAGCIDAGRNIRYIYNYTKLQKTTYLYVRY